MANSNASCTASLPERRHFLKKLALGTAALSLPVSSSSAEGATQRSAAAPPSTPGDGIIDTNVYLGRWPFRRVRGDEPGDLVRMLRDHGVSQAWVGSMEGPFHKDVRTLNERLVEQCRAHGDGLLMPFGTVNPQLPDWEEDLRLCDEKYGMAGIRLHPNYQNYALDDAVFTRLLEQADARDMIVQLVPWMRDERHHHTEMPVETVDLAPLPDAAQSFPDLKIVLLNGFRAVGVPPSGVLEADNIFFDFSKLDVLLGLRGLLDEAPLRRVLFGSFSPMFYFEQAPLKMKESALSEAETKAIQRENAKRLLPES